MAMLEEGFELNLDLFTDSTNGVNKVLVLTNVFDHIYNLVAATITEYNAAPNKIELSLSQEAGSYDGNAVETVFEASGSQYYAEYVDLLLDDSDNIIRVTDTIGYSYWKSYYLTTQSITFHPASGSEFGGSISASNLPLTFNILAGQTVQAVLLLHGTTEICYVQVAEVTDAYDYQYSIDTLGFTNS